MPYKERDINKMYYTMGEVSAMFEVNQSMIRFYEKEFDILQPKKKQKRKPAFYTRRRGKPENYLLI